MSSNNNNYNNIKHPYVFWSQTRKEVWLKVDLHDLREDPKLNVNDNQINFYANTQTIIVDGEKYGFDIQFYLPVKSNMVVCQVKPSNILIKIPKAQEGECWPRLTLEKQKNIWLKIDFDNFENFSDSADEKDIGVEEYDENMKKRIDEILNSDDNKTNTTILTSMGFGKTYLFLFCIFQWFGYNYVILDLILKKWEKAYDTAGYNLKICQTASILEIIHSIFGLTKGSPIAPFLQTFGRNFLLFIVISHEPRLQDTSIVGVLFAVWSFIEIIRFPYYMFGLLNKDFKILTCLRYNAWIPLYPLGGFCEASIIYMAIPYFEETGKWSFSLPNFTNQSFYFPYFLRIYLIIFLIGLCYLMKYMFYARKRKMQSTRKINKVQ